MKESAWLMQYNLSLLQIVLGQSFVDAANSPATARGTEMARSGGIWHLHFAFCVKSEMPTSSGPFFLLLLGCSRGRSNTL